MNVEYRVDIDPARIERVIGKLASPVQAFAEAFIRGVRKGAEILRGKARRERFTGKGPFPVPMRKLGADTGRVRRSLRVGGRIDIHGDTIRGYIGSDVEYFGAHEFGYQGPVLVAATKVAEYEHPNMFGMGPHRIPAHIRSPHTRNVNIPKRAPLRAAFDDHAGPVFGRAIVRELRAAIRTA